MKDKMRVDAQTCDRLRRVPHGRGACAPMLPVSLPARVPSVALIKVHATGELVEQPRYHGLIGVR